VTLAPAVAASAAPGDTVFVFARDAAGGRMPLAVQRATVADLPLAFRLDDAMAMAPNARLSQAKQVLVGARVSRSGNAMPQAGDLAGEASGPVAPGATGVAVVIGGGAAR
jgi:cytochrome c-type biogenesis protein CcmH